MKKIMRKIILISKCSRANRNKNEYHFKFKGVYNGQLIHSIVLQSLVDCEIILHQEYVLYLEIKSCEKRTLFGDLLKVKNLDEFKS